MKTKEQEVISWWYGNRDYNTGIALLSKYSKNKTIVFTLNKPGKEKFIASIRKLNYEVTKAANLNWLNMPDDPSPDFKIQAEMTAVIPEVDLPDFEKKSNEVIKVVIEEKNPEDVNQYPKVIRRLKYEYSNLYNRRSQLHNTMRKVPPENNEANNEIRKTSLAEAKSISKQLEFYYTFLNAFETKGIVPDEATVWPREKPAIPEEPKTLEQLKKIKNGLQTDSSKDKLRLLYNQRTKAEVENPMPNGPKRDAVKLKIKARDHRIEELAKQIKKLENAS